MKVSVIVPVYNMERYLSRTLESLKNQKLKNIEVIIVDDGSTDSTPGIIDTFVKEYPNFKKITFNHQGLAAARNAGLKAASGKYVTFLDGDDLYTKHFLNNMLEVAEKNNADMVVGRMMSFDDFGEHTFSSTGELALRKLTDRFDPDLIWNPSLSNKLFLRSRVKELGLELPDCGVAQEAVFSMTYALKSRVIACSRRGFTEYRTRGLDAVIDSSAEELKDYLTAYELIRQAAYESFDEAIDESKTEFDKNELLRERDDYFDQIYFKELTVILHRFYRRFWMLGEEVIALVNDAVESLREKLTPQASKKIIKNHRDIFPEGSLVLTKEELARNPIVCISVCGNLTKEQLESQIEYIFRQSLPAFEILVISDLKNVFPQKWLRLGNVRFIDAKSEAEFKDFALENTSAEYIMFLDRYTIVDLKGISRMFDAIVGSRDIDFVTSPVSRFSDQGVKEYESNTLAFIMSREASRSDQFPAFMLDLYFPNKLFRVSHLNGIKFCFSDNKVLDSYRLYVNSVFKKITDRGIYFSENEDKLLSEIEEEKDLVPPDCAIYLRKWKKLYKKNVIKKEKYDTLIHRLKKIKRVLIAISDSFFKTVFEKIPIKNKVLFYTIRADGKLLENSKCVYDELKAKKSICAHTLPHSMRIKPKIYYQILTSKVIVTDDYLRYMRFFRLRPEQKLIQIWHAGGAFKRFGLDAPSNLTRLAELQTHSQYTDVSVSSEHCRQFYAHAFAVDLSIVKPLGIPRTDSLLNGAQRAQMREKFFERHPKIKGKKIIVYFPTFREEGGKRVAYDPHIDWKELDEELHDDEIFAIHKHPVMKEDFLKGRFFHRIKEYSYEPTPTLLCVADVVVTDYSSVIFDSALLDLPTVFYCPDFDTYERDFYLRYPEDLPGPVAYSSENLMEYIREVIKNPPKAQIEEFRQNQVGACDGNSTQRIVELIDGYLKNK